MTFFQLAKDRYSVRSYKSQLVEPDKLAQILEAGRIAPTAANKQPQRIKVIIDPAELAKVDECTPCRFGAPAVLLVCYDKAACWKRKFDGANSGEVDASIITTHLMLAAEDLGRILLAENPKSISRDAIFINDTPRHAVVTEEWFLTWDERLGTESEHPGELYRKPDDWWEQNNVAARCPEEMEKLHGLKPEHEA